MKKWQKSLAAVFFSSFDFPYVGAYKSNKSPFLRRGGGSCPIGKGSLWTPSTQTHFSLHSFPWVRRIHLFLLWADGSQFSICVAFIAHITHTDTYTHTYTTHTHAYTLHIHTHITSIDKQIL